LKEIKAEENRVSMTPAGVEEMAQHGHTVLVERNAGRASGLEDTSYRKAGAEIIDTAGDMYGKANMIMHVKEPLAPEYGLIKEDQVIFTYLHLASSEELTKALIKRGSINIAYETIQKDDGSLPLLTPMSEVAGRMSIQEGAKSPKLVTRGMVKNMKKGSVMVDVAIDQGGCFETSKTTTHANPIYTVDGVVHYCVTNMPGALPRTSTLALTNATLPYAIEIADKGWKRAFQENPEIRRGANVVKGKVTYKGVADAFGLEYVPIERLL
jgi:alanine dehydrogenase